MGWRTRGPEGFSPIENGDLVLNSNNGYKLDPADQRQGCHADIHWHGWVCVLITKSGSTAQTTAGQIQLAHFANPQGLIQIGGNLYQQSPASGVPSVANPGLDGTGTLSQGVIEASNVDPVNELVDLIKTQRTFELNSQCIQAADQMLQQVANLAALTAIQTRT